MIPYASRLVALLVLLGCLFAEPAMSERSPQVMLSFDATSASPRRVEESTSRAIQRDYAHAWQSMTSALAENRGDLLNQDFTGTARRQLRDAVEAQKQGGLSRRIIDHGHRLRVTFYSLDGSALEADDTVDLEIQYLAGDKLLSSERIPSHYVVLLTPSENSWKVRVLQELPQP